MLQRHARTCSSICHTLWVIFAQFYMISAICDASKWRWTCADGWKKQARASNLSLTTFWNIDFIFKATWSKTQTQTSFIFNWVLCATHFNWFKMVQISRTFAKVTHFKYIDTAFACHFQFSRRYVRNVLIAKTHKSFSCCLRWTQKTNDQTTEETKQRPKSKQLLIVKMASVEI